ncbi:MAG: pyridoxal phosphate-dependent aminotransferase [Clostridiales bacterium]|nr:pyridoxal phosphate-dependent aminotransferase [Clostridiales bacterium]
MHSHFDKIIDRKNTNSLKYDFMVERGKPDGILPLWVADMDFRTPECVINALVEKSRHGIFGYSETKEVYFNVLKQWFHHRYKWEVEPEWLVKTPGVVFAICTAIRAMTEQGDAVLIQEPVYYPFSESVKANKRKLVINQLVNSGGRYTIDFSDFEDKIVKNKVKLFILCSPHNPVGRVWTKEELIGMGDICLKYGVTVISDEIHADFTYNGFKHFVFSDLKPEFSEITITCTAPTKTFNLAGLQISNIFIPNREIKRKFKSEIIKGGYSQLNIMGITACQAAYRDGFKWLSDLKEYLSGNLNFLRNFLLKKLPQIKLIEPEGTYLVWLDFHELGLSDEKLEDLIVNQAGLWLDSGTMFGAGGEGFQRINIACSRSILEKALIQLEQAVNSL